MLTRNRLTACVCIALIVIGTFAPGIVSSLHVSLVLDVWTLVPPPVVASSVEDDPWFAEQLTALVGIHASRPPPAFATA